MYLYLELIKLTWINCKDCKIEHFSSVYNPQINYTYEVPMPYDDTTVYHSQFYNCRSVCFKPTVLSQTGIEEFSRMPCGGLSYVALVDPPFQDDRVLTTW